MPRITKPIGDRPKLYPALGTAVRELRARRGISQEELGFRADLHRNYVGAMERGELNPTLRTLLRVSRGLDVTLLELVTLYEARVEETRSRANRIASR